MNSPSTRRAIDAGLAAVIAHFGSRAELARALGISRAAVSAWRRIPPGRALSLARLTGQPLAKLLREAPARKPRDAA